jgi:hypothetical protein
VEVSTTDSIELATALPTIIRQSEMRVTEIAPVDESMERVFRYLVEAAT